MMPSADLKARVLEAARRHPSPTRPVVRRNTWVLLGTAAAVLIAALLGLGVREGERPPDFVAGTAVGWATLALWATWAGFGRGRSMLGRPRVWLVGVAGATPLLLLAWILLVLDRTGAPAGAFGAQRALENAWPARYAVVCAVITLAMAAWPLVALAIARRDSDPIHPRATGAALGAAAGAWASVVIHLHCVIASPSHVALGHVLPVALLALFGAWLGDRVIALAPPETAPASSRPASRPRRG